ncbi:MAG: DNA (cytosine-5-)-methyltransferase [Oscillospiraceae bacterium]|nr:DNA (cytosine-5-)-methyltransferase [Oscillospiraceae bacterium]
MSNSITFVDLFCGIGGIRLGMERAGFECVLSCDINSECRKTYSENFGEYPLGDIKDISEKAIPNYDVLCAGFPCQPFSASGKQKGFNDHRGTLFFDICRIIEETQPKVVLLENVKNLIYHDGKRTLTVILEKLRELGYTPEWRLLNAVDFGVPQNRERIIIIASKNKNFDFNMVNTKKRTVLADFLDKKGNFEFLTPDEYTLIENPVTQKKSGLRFVGYRNKNIRKAGVRPGTEHLSRVHRQTNRIHSVNGSIPTLTSQETSGRYFIMLPDKRVRKLTLDECFRIMGFPETFKRLSAHTEQYKQMGNSVCVPMITAVADSIAKQYFKKEIYVYDTYRLIAANL